MKRALCAGLCGSALALPAPAAPQAVSIQHRGVGCVEVGKFSRFEARFDPSDAVGRARLYFRPVGSPLWYWVPMNPPKAGDPTFYGTLPKPEKTLKKFEYYITAVDRAFHEARTEEFAPEVVAGPAACQQGRMLAAALPKARSVIVHGPEGVAGAPKVPGGFSGSDVVAGAGGTAGAAPGASAAAAAAGAAVAHGGLSAAAVLGIVAGGAAVAGGVAVAAGKGGASGTPSSTIACSPGGGFGLRGSFRSGPQVCATTSPQMVWLRNDSCVALTISSFTITIDRTIGGFRAVGYPLSFSGTASLLTRSVAPGSEALIDSGDTPFAACCGTNPTGTPGGGCDCGFLRGRTDVWYYTYTVETSLGPQSLSSTHSDDLADCPNCPGC